MKTIIHIVNNPGNIKDGIGLYGNNLALHLRQDKRVQNVIIEGADTTDLTKMGMITSGRMIRAINQAKMDLSDDSIVIIEYPFQEYNPFIIVAVYLLKRQVKKRKGILVLSLHEYLRANLLRKKVIDVISSIADIVFVTDEKTKNALLCRNNNIFLRDIPIVISVDNNFRICDKDKKRYIFMGLVNRSKAFEEMITAWKIFNEQGTRTLEIYTSSDVQISDTTKYGIIIHKSKSDETIAKAMQKAAFCICPVKPYITKANSSFATGCLAGCIALGVVGDFLKNEEFVLKMKDYSLQCFLETLNMADNMPEGQFAIRSSNAVDFIKKAIKSYPQVAKEFLDICELYRK